MMDLRSAARALGGEVVGRGIVCPGPNHSRQDRSLSILFDASAPGGLVVFDHARGDHLAAKDYVRERLGISAQIAPKLPQPSIKRDNIHVETSSDRTALALRIWGEAKPAADSPVEAYLANRGLNLVDNINEVIRFHPACPFAGTRTPAMVALVRNVVTDEPQAIHRTAITLEGKKAIANGKGRLALGPLSGGAVKLTADSEVTYCLGIGEGIESVLSMRALPEFGERTPVWALLNTAGVTAFPVLAGIESIWVAADHDTSAKKAGQKAANTCAGRWRFAGKEAFVVMPTTPGHDLNDIARGGA